MEEFLALSDEQQEALLKRLTHSADFVEMRRAHLAQHRLTKGGTVPSGYEPYDFALDAVRKLLDGTRPGTKRHTTPLKSLCSPPSIAT